MTFMGQAIALARQALGTTSPNPAVGAVLVKNNDVVGRGATQPPGQAHAEIVALGEAGDLARGASLFVTLEPCCHWGRTPPCTGAIIEAGISRVFVASTDPNPAVSGRGIQELRSAGIEVSLLPYGSEDQESSRELYEGFNKHVNTGMPFVTAKFAMSLDGKIATRTGDSKWVTGPEARAVVQRMRRESDAVMVGIKTVLADNPALTARDESGRPLAHQPLRVALDSHCRMPVASQLLHLPGRTLVYTTAAAPPESIRGLEKTGAEVLTLGATAVGQVCPEEALADLGRRGVVNLLVEGGGLTLGSLFDTGLVDKVCAFVAPVIIGGIGAASPVEGSGAELMADALRLERISVRHIAPDWLISGYPQAKKP